MKIIENNNFNIINDLFKKVFFVEMPKENYIKKSQKYEIKNFIYEENEEKIGFSSVVLEKDKKNIYAWYGGVIPKYQGNSITKLFFDFLVNYAKENGYKSITVATTNSKPHMIIFAIKYGFEIVRLKNRQNISNNKIYFQYNIDNYEIETIELNDEYIELASLERKIVKICKNKNSKLIIKKNINIKNIDEVLLYINKYICSFKNKIKIEVYDNY